MWWGLLLLISYAFGQCFDPSCTNCTAGAKVCTSCQGGKNLDFQGYCVSQCINGFYFNTTSKMCATCAGDRCTSCNSNNTCTGCQAYYGLKNNVCTGCPPHAYACIYNQQADRMDATACEAGYYPSNGQCVGCQLANCEFCLTATTCAICNNGYGLDNSDKCIQCSAHCLSCINNGARCTQCETGYANSNGVCVGNVCSSSICEGFGQYVNPKFDGVNCGGSCQADECCIGVQPGWIGYYQYQSTGIDDCGTFRQMEALKPDTCGDSSILGLNYMAHCNDSNQTIQLVGYIGDNCTGFEIYNTDDATDACIRDPAQSRYAIFSCPNRRCSPSIYCKKCLNNTCQLCEDGYYPSGNTCNQCTAHCSECTDGNTCITCEGGYYASGGSCVACSSLPNCRYCLSASTCGQCNDGYYPDATGKCTPCFAHCDVCTILNMCLQCSDGYDYNNINNTCVAFAPHAVSQHYDLSGNIVIDFCESGYYVNTDRTQCLACPSGCATCSPRAGDVYCSACFTGQGFINGPQQCSACNSDWHCRECLPYYYDNKDGCLRCPSGYFQDYDHHCNSAAGLSPVVSIAFVLVLLAMFSA